MTDIIDIVAGDFDGTIGNTLTKSPHEMDVSTAYRYAIGDIFGDETYYDAINGMRNRAPVEIVTAVLGLDQTLGKRGHQYYLRHCRELAHLVPDDKGIGNRINPGLTDELTETLVRVKLKYLIDEISPQWPKPFDGFPEVYEELERRRIALAIITSGHDIFLDKVFQEWGLKRPRFTVTDDDMRAFDVAHHEKCKPSPFLWYVLGLRISTSVGKTITPKVRCYVGDCALKDRGLALGGKVPFGWFNPERQGRRHEPGPEEFELHSWRELSNWLH